jgi:hypothetical protein
VSVVRIRTAYGCTGLYTADGCGLLSRAGTPRWNRAELCYNAGYLATVTLTTSKTLMTLEAEGAATPRRMKCMSMLFAG